MSLAILTAQQNVRFGKATQRISINNTEANTGVVVSGSQFTLADPGLYIAQAILQAGGINDPKSFVIDLYDETAGAVLQSFGGQANSFIGGSDVSFVFSFTNTAGHSYSFRITAQGSGNNENMLTLANCRTIIQKTSSLGGNVGPGTVNTVAKFTAVNTVGNSSITDDGTTITANNPISIVGQNNSTAFLNLADGQNDPVSVANNGSIRFNAATEKLEISENTGAWTTLTPTGGGIGGSGTINTIPKFTASQTIGNSAISDDGTTVAIALRAVTISSVTGGGNIPLTITSDASQTVDLLQVNNVYGGNFYKVTNTGILAPWNIVRAAKAAPTISTIAYVDPVITITTTGSHGLVPGDIVTLAGITPTTFNSVYTVATVTSATVFTINNTNSIGLGTYVSGGTVTPRPGVQYGGTCPLPNGENLFTPTSTGRVPIEIYPFSTGQTANLFAIKDSFGANQMTFSGTAPLMNLPRISGMGLGTATISNVAFTGTTATITTAAAHTYANGRQIVMAATTNTLLNGPSTNKFTITSTPTKYTFTYTITPAVTYVTNVAGDGTTATLTTGTVHGLSTGSFVTIAGLTNTGFNVSNVAVASVPTTTTFTYLNATNLGSTADNGTCTLVSITSIADTGNVNSQPCLNVGGTPLNGILIPQSDVVITGSAAGTVPLLVMPISTAQTANLISAYDALGTVQAAISSAGVVTSTRQTPTPAVTSTLARVTFSGTTATITFATRHNISVGRLITPALVTNTLLNGPANTVYQVVTVPTDTTLTYTITPTVPAVNNVSGNGTTATLTTASAHGFGVGAVVTVAGLTNAGFNAASVTVTAVGSTTTFSYLNATVLGSTPDAGTVTLVSLTSLADTGTIGAKLTTAYGGNVVNASTLSVNDNVFVATGTNKIPLTVQGIASQTANLFAAVNSTGTNLNIIGANGAQTISPSADVIGFAVKQFTDTPAGTAVSAKGLLLTAGATWQLGNIPGTPADGMLALGNVTPSSTVWHVRGNSTVTYLNNATSVNMRIANTDVVITTSSAMTLQSGMKLATPVTIQTAGNTGNKTANTQTGNIRIAASGTTVTVTNSLVTATSIILCTIGTNDTTATIKNCVAGAGSFVITLTAGATAETVVNWMVIN